MKKLVIVLAAIAMIAMMWIGSHIYRSDAEVVATADYIGFERVYIDLENGHRYAFDVVDSDNIYSVGNVINVAMWDEFTPSDPTDDIIL